MTAFQITSMKQFMSRLLASDAFDCFLLEEAVIGVASTITIDGRINREFFAGQTPKESDGDSSAEPGQPPLSEEFRPWSELRGLCYDLIKGRRTPLFFRFTMHLTPEKAAALLARENCAADPAQVKALVLNIRYDGSRAVLTTAVSYQTFILTKEPEIIWDKALTQYLDAVSVEYEIL
ncbi:MAG: DUF5721 family protein [Roseburia sp.]|nr:DUF5721 family protein [Roseburia sp.]MCM1096731.1 DUF5721 family protein [Ruminococcus flavefaciens]MCM1233364.1 DUF5721 family protein [Ruminococcus flavefaciens]